MHYVLNYVVVNEEALKSSIRRRFLNSPIEDPVGRLIELNKTIKKTQLEVDALRHERNLVSQEFSHKDISVKNEEKEKIRTMMNTIRYKENELNIFKEEVRKLFLWLPNVISNETPDGRDDTENKEIRKVGDIGQRNFKVLDHAVLGEKRGLLDIDSASIVAGSRFYYLKGKLVQLALALEMYSINKLASKGYIPILPPYMLKREIYDGIAHLATFEDALYKVSGVEEGGEEEDRFLISTTEHPMIAMYANKIIREEELPIKLVGVSPAFRREAGSHGKDPKGIFRIHQFDQTEQIVFCKPEESNRIHEEILNNAEGMWHELGIPYRIMNMCAGDMGVRDVKQYDIEAYLYSQKTYKEVGSFDNTTDWISRRLNIKFTDKHGNKQFINTLDGTGLPIQRAIITIVDNFQGVDGVIKIPSVLTQYTGFKEI